MAQRRPRPCLVCGTLTRNPSRCDTHQAQYNQRVEAARGSAADRGYGPEWRRLAARVVAEWRSAWGDWCPGWQVEAHPAKDLTADHKIPRSQGGTDDRENLQVLCRACNSRKHNRAASG